MISAMSQTDQLVTLESFKKKEIQGIVATSVAEEGIDIPDCDLVILYNYIGNEVSYKQAMGRLLFQYYSLSGIFCLSGGFCSLSILVILLETSPLMIRAVTFKTDMYMYFLIK